MEKLTIHIVPSKKWFRIFFGGRLDLTGTLNSNDILKLKYIETYRINRIIIKVYEIITDEQRNQKEI